MTWQDSLRRSSRDSDIAEKVVAAVEHLLQDDHYLFMQAVGERAISHRLACYLDPLFEGWNVDCEYNRDGDLSKRIPPGSGDDEGEGSRVLPDIIIHRRGSNENLVVFELKKSSNPQSDQRDIDKLRAYGSHLGYLHGVFIRFIVGQPQPGVINATFIYSQD